MANSPVINVKDAKSLLKNARGLLKKGRKVLPEAQALEIDIAIEALSKVLDNDNERPIAAQKLEGLVNRHLGFAKKSPAREYVESIGVAVFVALVIRSFIFEPFKIPSPSMVPTLMVGDRLYVSKMTYGIRLPLTSKYLVMWKQPKVGDIVVFEFPRKEALVRNQMGELIQHLEMSGEQYPRDLSKVGSIGPQPIDAWGTKLQYEAIHQSQDYTLRSAGPDRVFGSADDITREMVESTFISFPDLRRPTGEALIHRCPVDPDSLKSSKNYIKRIVGLPGDTVELVDSQLILNGNPIQQEFQGSEAAKRTRAGVMTAKRFTETMPNGGPSYTVRLLFDDEQFGPITVPEGYFLGIGDNRDESSDGRCWGFAPIESIKGQAKFVLFSSAPSGGFDASRTFQPLQ